jgi:hypothetical protein
MYEEVEINDVQYTKYPPVHGITIYIETALSRLTKDGDKGLYPMIKGWDKKTFMSHIGDDIDEIFHRPEEAGDRNRYEMVYKPGSWTAVLVRQR